VVELVKNFLAVLETDAIGIYISLQQEAVDLSLCRGTVFHVEEEQSPIDFEEVAQGC
jgi:hypothetical protein